MPIIRLNDGTSKRVNYDTAARLNTYLDHPEKLEEIEDAAERKKKSDYLLRIAAIDWSDTPTGKGIRTTKTDRTALKKALNDPKLKGKQVFDAVRRAMGAA